MATILTSIALASFADAPRPTVSIETRFECLWWSPEQMENLDPNQPPPKNTRVTIERWEYTDPIGVPHPDRVDLVVDVHNDKETVLENLLLRAEGQWLDGKHSGSKGARWSPKMSLEASPQPFRLEPGETKTFRIPIDVGAQQKQMEPARWPWAFRASVAVRTSPAGSPPLARIQADLPIRPGD